TLFCGGWAELMLLFGRLRTADRGAQRRKEFGKSFWRSYWLRDMPRLWTRSTRFQVLETHQRFVEWKPRLVCCDSHQRDHIASGAGGEIPIPPLLRDDHHRRRSICSSFYR